MALNFNVIPIMFVSGSGGHFLSSCLRRARLNITSEFNFSTYGNSHNETIDYGILFCRFTTLSEQMKKISEFRDMGAGDKPPYFPPSHALSIDQTLKIVKKVIKITYEEDDINDIASAYIIKHDIEEEQIDFINYTRFISNFHTFRNQLQGYNKVYYPDHTYGNRILNLSWKDLYKNDIIKTISKLSDFTGINKEQFSIDFFEKWRYLTLTGISKITDTINTGDLSWIKNDYSNKTC